MSKIINDINNEDVLLDNNEDENDITAISELKQGINYVIYIDNLIKEAYNYRKAYNILRDANEQDTITIVLNTEGGDLDASLQFYYYILKCKAKVIAELHVAFSGGSIILFSCDEIILNEFCSVLIHSLTFTGNGKVNEHKIQTDFLEKKNKEIFLKIYNNFLTKEELHKALKGEDLWFDYEQIKEKLKKWDSLKKRNQKYAKTTK